MQERINRLADALEERQRADEEATRHQRRFEEEPLELPPGGELHAVAPKEEPSLEGSDNVGDLPKELEDPPDPVPEPRGAVYPQPVAISLNKE
jgi:hypothetical protein